MTVAMEMEMPAPGEWTTDDLDELPEDGRRRELIDGVLFVSPSPTSFHQSIAGIPFYWRIETDGPVTITTHRLDLEAEVYVETGIHRGALQLDEPFPVNLSVETLTLRPNRRRDR